MKTIKELKAGCNEAMPYNKCGELKPNYWNGKKIEPIYCMECKALLKQLKDVLGLIEPFRDKLRAILKPHLMEVKRPEIWAIIETLIDQELKTRITGQCVLYLGTKAL